MKARKHSVLFISILLTTGFLSAQSALQAAAPEDSPGKEKIEQMSDRGQDTATQTAGQSSDSPDSAKDKETPLESPPESGVTEGNEALSSPVPQDQSELENWDPEQEMDEAGSGTNKKGLEETKKKNRHASPVMRIIEKSTRSLIEKRGGSTPARPLTKEEIETDLIEIFIEEGMKISLILILTVVAITTANLIAKNTIKLISKDRQGSELKKRATTVSSVIRYLLIGGILATAGMMILKELKIDIAPILAGAGVLTLAAGFGSQSLVKDMISGFFILLEDQIRVGDVVSIADKKGTVEKVTLRMVALRDVRGSVHYIPSGEITVVTNMTKDFSRYLFDIGIAYKENTDAVISILKEIDKEMHEEEKYSPHLLGDLEVMGVQRFESSAVIIRARIKTSPGRQWMVGREYNRRIKLRFDQEGIEIPYPHMTVYPGKNKDGSSPSYALAISERSAEDVV